MISKIYLHQKKMILLFFILRKYKDIAKNTKASFCFTTEILKNELPKSCTPLVVVRMF